MLLATPNILITVAALIAALPFCLRRGLAESGHLPHFLTTIYYTPLLATSLAATPLMYLANRRPSRYAMAVIVMLSSLLATLFWLAGVGAAYWVGAPVIMGGATLGIACLGASILGGNMRTIFATAAIPVNMGLAGTLLKYTVALHPKTLDLMLYAFDETLGGEPCFWMGRLFAQCELLRNSAFLAYILLPVALSFANLFEQGLVADGILAQFVAFGIVGSLAYNLFPAAGPTVSFAGAFPFSPPSIKFLSVAPMLLLSGVRNAMPSLHMAWALLLFWHSRPWRAEVRAVFALFLALTMAATLGLGEHYLIDLVVAFPFALAVRAAFARKIGTSVTGAATMCLWMFLLRNRALISHPNPWLNWLLVILTVGSSWWLDRGLVSPRTNAANTSWFGAAVWPLTGASAKSRPYPCSN